MNTIIAVTNRTLFHVSAVAIVLSMAAPARAGEGLEEVIVTAQRRSERLQDVPIAITAITSQALAGRGIRSNEEIVQATPSLVIGRSGSTPLLYLRGVGNQSGSPGSEPSVPLYIDGVYVLGQMNTLTSFNNIDRVEVLRGPQGTLFGRNATGGLIHLITKDPAATPSVEARVGYGNYNTLTGSLYATAGLNEKIAGNIALNYKNQDKGFGRNITTGQEVYKTEEYAGRAKLLFTPSDDTRITLAGDYVFQNSDVGLVRHLGAGIIGLNGVTRWNGNPFDVSHNLNPKSITTRYSVSAKIEQDLHFARFISISAYQRNTDKWLLDLDGTPASIVHADVHDVNAGWTQEIQLQAPAEASIQWVVGAYYLNSTVTQKHQTITGATVGAAGFLRRHGSVDTDSISGFAQATVPLREGTNVTGGLRWTQDEKALEQGADTALGAGAIRRDQLKSSQITYRAAIDQKIAPDAMIYFTASRGYKSGEFNLTNANNPPIRPESLNSYEGGFKSELLDRRVRLNVTAFYYDYKDLQLSQQLGSSTLVLNAARARIKGAEAEFQAAVTEELTLNAGIALLYGKYLDFPNAPFSFNEPYTCALGGPGPGDPNFGNQQCVGNAAGKTTVRSPKFTGNFAVNYTTTVAGGETSFNAAAAYTSKFYFETDNRLNQEGYVVVNSDLSWTTPSDRVTFRVWARNLLNKDYATVASASTADQYGIAEPRTFGGDVTVRF